MAIFKKKTTVKTESKKTVAKKTETTKKDAAVVATVVAPVQQKKAGKALDLSMILVRPHVTEKASDLSEKGVYVFDVNTRANKSEVEQAVRYFFKVTPTKIAIINKKPKYARNPRTNRVEVKHAGSKKALVYLKKGDKIEFV